jgi:hypothetical protein
MPEMGIDQSGPGTCENIPILRIALPESVIPIVPLPVE